MDSEYLFLNNIFKIGSAKKYPGIRSIATNKLIKNDFKSSLLNSVWFGAIDNLGSTRELRVEKSITKPLNNCNVVP